MKKTEKYVRKVAGLNLLRQCRRREGICLACPNGEEKPQPALLGKRLCAKHAAMHSESQQKRRVAARAAGLCARCCKGKAPPGRHCGKCLARRKKSNLKAQSSGLCVNCHKERSRDGAYCNECLWKRSLARERRAP